MLILCLSYFITAVNNKYEATATSLAFTAYLIAANPDVQEQLITCILEKFGCQLLFRPEFCPHF
jgi:hypothetical protein